MESNFMNNFKTGFRFLALIIILGLSLLSVASLASAQLTSYNNVQINIQTSNIQSGYFTVSAFNMTGYQESSVQTYYPAASFELPNGQYIFTVTANDQTNSNYPVPVVAGASSSSGESTPAIPALPIPEVPAIEYGSSVQQISSSVSLTIATQSVSSFPTNTLTVQVLFANGTAAAGASVSASTIGSSYYWGYESNVVTWTTTGPDGYATLITPIAPEQINAWYWQPISPTSNPPSQTIIGGTSGSASGPMIPAYLGLAGSTLIVPPQTTATITMTTQQQNYWVTPYAATATPGTSSGTSSVPSAPSASSSAAGPGAIPASVYDQQQGNPALSATQPPASIAPSSSPTSGNTLLLTILVAIVIAGVAVAGLMIARRTRRKQQLSSLQSS
jgi:hypothetical protein